MKLDKYNFVMVNRSTYTSQALMLILYRKGANSQYTLNYRVDKENRIFTSSYISTTGMLGKNRVTGILINADLVSGSVWLEKDMDNYTKNGMTTSVPITRAEIEVYSAILLSKILKNSKFHGSIKRFKESFERRPQGAFQKQSYLDKDEHYRKLQWY